MKKKHEIKENYFVSIIMPTYNQDLYIREAIESVLNQTYSKIELIIIDNFSKDNTELVINSFNNNKIRYFKYNNNGIIAAGRNYGVKKAKGDILAFLDSDDVWLPDKLATQIQHIDINIQAVSTSFSPIGNTKIFYNHLSHIKSNSYLDYNHSDIIKYNPVMTSSLIIKKDIFDYHRGFDEKKKYRFIEDWELWTRVSLNGPIRVLGAKKIYYRISEKTDRDLRVVSKNTINIIKKQYNSKLISKSEYRKAIGNCYVNIGKTHLDMRDFSGIKYYIYGILLSSGLISKIRAFYGLFLFILPNNLSQILDRMLRNFFNK